jgi:thioredoxin-related protein
MKLLLFVILLGLYSSTYAQDWSLDIDDAIPVAAAEGRNVLIVFQGSDWCAPCMKLEREILETDTFKAFAKDHLVLVKADFPRKKKNRLSKEQQQKNEALADHYNTEGIFPLVVLIDKERHILGKTGYKNIPPEEYVNELITLTNN